MNVSDVRPCHTSAPPRVIQSMKEQDVADLESGLERVFASFEREQLADWVTFLGLVEMEDWLRPLPAAGLPTPPWARRTAASSALR